MCVIAIFVGCIFFFFKQKTAYEMRISDWSSDVCSSDLVDPDKLQGADDAGHPRLYMPDPVRGGSSGSHYDTSLAPNALIEPAIHDSLDASPNIDIPANLLPATGWTLYDGQARLRTCHTRLDVRADRRTVGQEWDS